MSSAICFTFDQTKMLSSCNGLNVVQMIEFVFAEVENIVEKGENAGCQHFLLFAQCFPKASTSGSLKVRIVW